MVYLLEPGASLGHDIYFMFIGYRGTNTDPYQLSQWLHVRSLKVCLWFSSKPLAPCSSPFCCFGIHSIKLVESLVFAKKLHPGGVTVIESDNVLVSDIFPDLVGPAYLANIRFVVLVGS
jgi:hypothetical protein